MKHYLFLLASLLLLSCSPESNSKTSKTSEKETTFSKNDNPKVDDEVENMSAPTKPKEMSLEVKEIQKLVNFKGTIEEFIQWSDQEGLHIVLTSETGVYNTNITEDESYHQNADVSCIHYLQKDSLAKFDVVWKIQDYSHDCPVDAGANFKKSTLQQTDLDKDGAKEIWVMYYTYCKGDVSPSNLKLIMYEGNTKYKMSGNTSVNAGGDYNLGGEILSEGKFKENADFLSFAKTLWKKNCGETFGE